MQKIKLFKFQKLKNKKGTSIVIENPVFPYDVAVSINQTDKEFSKFIKPLNLDFQGDKIEKQQHSTLLKGRTIQFEEGQIVMRINFIPETPEEFSILSHEIFHIVDLVLSSCGVELCKQSDECFAYMISYYTREIFKLLKN